MVDNARIDPGAIIGEGAEISRSAVIGSSVVLGRSVHIDAGSIVIGPCEIGDGCTIAAGCILDPSSDPAAGTLRMDPGVALLPGVMVVSKLHIGTGARILAGTVVHRSIPPHAIVQGNPAQIVGKRCGACFGRVVGWWYRRVGIECSGSGAASPAEGTRPARQLVGRRIRTDGAVRRKTLFYGLWRAQCGDTW